MREPHSHKKYSLGLTHFSDCRVRSDYLMFSDCLARSDWRVLWAGALMAKIFFVLMIPMVFFIIFGT